MAREVPFEVMALADESVRGTAIATPTHRLNWPGLLIPRNEMWYPDDNLQGLDEYERSEVIYQFGEFASEGGADLDVLPFLANSFMGGNVTTPTIPSTPAQAVLTRDFEFIRVSTVDDLRSKTIWNGDPTNGGLLERGAWGMIDEFRMGGNASETGGVTMGISGHTQFPETLGSNPVLPAKSRPDTLVGARQQIYMDTGATAIGSTLLVGRTVNSAVVVPSGATYKRHAIGPEGTLTYDLTGRRKTHPTIRLVLDMVDPTQFALYKAGTRVKLRVRYNGPLIEDISGTKFYKFAQWDIYGRLSDFDFGQLETNRTFEATVHGESEASIGGNLRLVVRTTKTTL